MHRVWHRNRDKPVPDSSHGHPGRHCDRAKAPRFERLMLDQASDHGFRDAH
jgi:hypothetical protein